MKIAFLLPTLLSGKDGIADYTSKLASWCVGAGHEVLTIPLGRNDWLKDSKVFSSRMAAAKAELDTFCPDVISWQFDGQIFHPHSIFPRWVVPHFYRKNTLVHLMAHETWGSNERDARLIRRIKWHLQRESVSRAFQIIRPDICHTSNALYSQHLQSCGLESKILPLSSAISAISEAPTEFDYLASALKLVFFGGFHDHWDPRPFLHSLKATGERFEIHHVGRVSHNSSLTPLVEGCGDWAKLVRHGEAAEAEVSRILLNAHFGISTYNPPHLLKSSIYAAFVEHGLPVISPRIADPQFDFISDFPPNVIAWKQPFPSLREFRRFPLKNTLQHTGEQFLHDIKSAATRTRER